MTATLHQLGTGRDAGRYYTSDPNREVHNRDEYYAAGGGGVWWSTGETIVRNGAPITVETFRDLCAGVDPRTGKALVRGAGEKHRAGLDVTFTPGKSVSVLWMSGNKKQREQIESAHRTAVTRALQLVLDEELVMVRHGAGGVHRAKPADLIVGRFDHFTTRAGDPNIHTHAVIINIAGSSVKSIRYGSHHLTIETDTLFKAQLMLGSGYRSALAEQLAKLGFEFRPAGQGQFELAGLPQELLEIFSKRSHDIEDKVGRGASAAQKEVAALSTRQAKANVLTGAELEVYWQRELAETGMDPWFLATNPGPEQSQGDLAVDRLVFVEPAAIAGTSPVAVAASELLVTESVLDRQRLLEKAFVAASMTGIGPDAVYAELAQLEADGSLVRLDKAHWTTPGIAATEAEMLRAADRHNERNWILPEALNLALANAPHLSPEQVQAIRTACQPDGVSLVEAAAGTGKTTLAKALVAAAKQSNMTVIGLAPSWIAADELGKSAEISAYAIAKWRFNYANGTAPTINPNTLIVVDEAGMVGTGDMSAVLVTARAASAKVVLMGDRRQLQSVSGASALSAVADVLETFAVLDTVRRQKIEWQKTASVLMARGDVATALRAYARQGFVDLVNGEEMARIAVIEKWTEARHRHGEDVLIVTRRNIDAIALNNQARITLKREGVIASEEITLPSIGRDDKARDLAISVGDKIRFGESLPSHGIRNGTRATVEAIGPPSGVNTKLRLRLDGGAVIDSAWGDLARQLPGRKTSSPRISYSYSGTSYSVQSKTASAAVLHIASKTDAREIYVGLTRHQHEAHIVVETDRLEAGCRQRQEDSRVKPTKIAMLERLFAEAGQYREKSNVIDYVLNRAGFLMTGLIELDDTEHRWRLRIALLGLARLAELTTSLRNIWSRLARHKLADPSVLPRLPEHFETLRQKPRANENSVIRERNVPSLDL